MMKEKLDPPMITIECDDLDDDGMAVDKDSNGVGLGVNDEGAVGTKD